MSSTLGKVRRTNGIAGQFSLSVEVQYPEERPQEIAFVGSTYGGPIVMVTEAFGQMFVSEPNRFGDQLDESWVLRFFGASA